MLGHPIALIFPDFSKNNFPWPPLHFSPTHAVTEEPRDRCGLKSDAEPDTAEESNTVVAEPNTLAEPNMAALESQCSFNYHV